MSEAGPSPPDQSSRAAPPSIGTERTAPVRPLTAAATYTLLVSAVSASADQSPVSLPTERVAPPHASYQGRYSPGPPPQVTLLTVTDGASSEAGIVCQLR